MSDDGHRENGSLDSSRTSAARRLFESFAAELEDGHTDPEPLFRAHPDLESELRQLYRGWLEADALLRGVAADGSILRSVHRGVSDTAETAAVDEQVARLVPAGFAARYRVDREIGRGGMGVVLLVFDQVLGRELAMKVMRPLDPRRRLRFLRRFLAEAAVLARLEHPGVVPIHDLGLDADGQPYFTMPLVRGITLRTALQHARTGSDGWTRARVLDVLLKVCEALSHAHARGVLHRDLKPANVMLGRFGEVYVLDWGLAGASAAEDPEPTAEIAERPPLTLHGEVLGTPAYMAPEQARPPAADLDVRCDVYAVGAILYELLAGERPYGDCPSATALEHLCAGPPAPVETLVREPSEELCAIVRRAMARERSARYPTMAALAADLLAFRDGRVVAAHRTGAWIEARKWIARNRSLAGALAAAALLLLAGLVTSLLLLRRAERERSNVFRLAQTRTLADLIERTDALWPALPDRLPAMRAWQDEARALANELDAPAGTSDGSLRAQLASLERRRAAWTAEDRWWHGELSTLVRGIEDLLDPERGLAGSGCAPTGFGMQHRIAQAERVAARFAEPATRAAWREACARIAAAPRYAGLRLAVQTGLVPLGPDPESGLEEFAHLLSGEVPPRDENGRLVLADDSAIVLVLVPAASFVMGSQVDDPRAPNFCERMPGNEYPAHRRDLEASFLGKHEVTQAQWQRLAGTNPSFFADAPHAARLPVETITWNLARTVLARSGLRLPTEAEWEHGCRGGATTEYFWGDDLLGVVLYGNVKDLAKYADGTEATTLVSPLATNRPTPDHLNANDHVPVRDGFRDLAPVGSFRPNAFGLHDVIGNVWEWCEDVLDHYPGAKGTRFADVLPARELRVMRGGAYYRTHLRSADRGREGPEFAYQGVGVRAARSVEHDPGS